MVVAEIDFYAIVVFAHVLAAVAGLGVGLPIAVVLLAAGPLFFGPNEERLARLAERDIEA